MLPYSEIPSLYATASRPQLRPIISISSRSSWRDRSGLITVQSSPWLAERNTRLAAKKITELSCGEISSGEDQFQR